jgi:hypothetical protein
MRVLGQARCLARIEAAHGWLRAHVAAPAD